MHSNALQISICFFLEDKLFFPYISHLKAWRQEYLVKSVPSYHHFFFLSPGCFISLFSAQTRFLLFCVLHEQNVAQVAKITRRLGHHVVGYDDSSLTERFD